MECIYCRSETKVSNSRPQKRTNQIWRRRQCLGCGATFTTEEAVVPSKSILVRKMTDVEPFQRDKLLLSLYDSLRHRKTALADATALADTVWSRTLPLVQEATIQRDDIVREAHAVLKRFDKPAATAYRVFHPLINNRQ